MVINLNKVINFPNFQTILILSELLVSESGNWKCTNDVSIFYIKYAVTRKYNADDWTMLKFPILKNMTRLKTCQAEIL